MNKHLVVCCDGTWNRPDQLKGGVLAPTNVSKIALGVSPTHSDGSEQLLYYQRGVGTRQLEHFSGGAFGYGLSRNVRDCYAFLVDNYIPGDKIYFFGFSRGAYTARSTVGFIHNCGILRLEHRGRIKEAYGLYRSRADRAHPSTIEARLFRRSYAHDEVEIRFVGVWDTVGSLGIPIDGLRFPGMDKYWGFHDVKLSKYVRSAYHALAIDEQRGPFKPTIWEQSAGADGQVLEQVWFSGVHSDVGGGYVEQELAEIPLLWMVDRARACGLEFRRDHFVLEPNPPDDEDRWLGTYLAPDALGPIHDSRRSFYRLIAPYQRPLANRDRQTAASSAVRRKREKADYRSPSLEKWIDADGGETDVQDGS